MISKLLEQIRQGDRTAFSVLYHELKQPVYVVVRRIVGAEALAEDLMQDLFVKLFVSPPDPSVKNPRAWIFRMARNLAIDALRRQQPGELPEDLPAADPTEAIHLRMDLEQAIGSLPRDQREILSLHLNAELPFCTVAQIVGRSLPAVYRSYRRAIKTLRDTLNGGTQ